MDFFFWLLQIVLLVCFVYLVYSRSNLSYWSSRGVHGPTPLPFVGNYLEQAWKGVAGAEMEWSKKYGKVYGSFQVNQSVLKPGLTILDNELIRQVLVKDFSSFVNRRNIKLDHDIWCRNLGTLQNDDWKRVRTIVSPTFSSVKLRGMHAMMNRCIDKLDEYFDRLATKANGTFMTRKVVSGFTIDVIASTSFATEINTNDDDEKGKPNPIVEHANKVFQVPIYRVLMLVLFPRSIRKLLGLQLTYKPEHFEYFCDLLKQVVAQRKIENQRKMPKRNDLVQLLMDAYVSESELACSNYNKLAANIEQEVISNDHKSEQMVDGHNKLRKSLDENEIIAQCIIFFTAGFETTATTLTYFLYEMALNPDIQQRLARELEQSLSGFEFNSEEYYETVLNKIPYLEAVIKETLRKYPPIIRLERTAGVDGYKLAGVSLKKNDLVNIPVIAIHHNPEYYPDPDRFNPERFMPENKHLLVPYTYLPFGGGPRNCIGMRFSIQEIKLLLARMVPRFHFTSTSQTPAKIKFNRGGLLSSKDFELKVVKR